MLTRRQTWTIWGALILVEELAFALHHMLWTSPWWREPFLGSDRWHVLSWFAHWPLALAVTIWLVLYTYADERDEHPVEPWWRNAAAGVRNALLLAVFSFGLWQLARVLTGKDWPSWWLNFWR